MGNPLRDKDPELYRLITIRTEGARLWMRPSKDVNKIIGSVLARYSEILKITLYSYAFLSNHYHLLLKAPKGNADEFAENVNREIARRINWKLFRSGKFWARRYSEQAVLSEDDLLEAFLYVSTNPTKHGLVPDSRDWPGLCSINQSLSDKTLTYSFYHHSAEEEKDRITQHSLVLTPLPQHQGLSKKDRNKELTLLFANRTKFLVDERIANGKGFLGVQGIREQNPHSIPETVSKSPRPPCYTRNAELRKEFRKAECQRRKAYFEASMKYRLGDYQAQFPIHTHKPPRHRKPRVAPFVEMPDDYFKNAA